MQNITYIDLIYPQKKSLRIILDICVIFSFSFLLALSSKISIILPWTPIPITFQTSAVLLSGLLLGSRRSFLVVLSYILEGILGLPVFAFGGGFSYLLGPTGGYIVGFLFAAYITGFFSENGFDRKIHLTFIAMVIGNLIIYLFGVVWLSKFVGLKQAFIIGVLPFILIDLIKISFVSMLFPFGWFIRKKLVGKNL